LSNRQANNLPPTCIQKDSSTNSSKQVSLVMYCIAMYCIVMQCIVMRVRVKSSNLFNAREGQSLGQHQDPVQPACKVCSTAQQTDDFTGINCPVREHTWTAPPQLMTASGVSTVVVPTAPTATSPVCVTVEVPSHTAFVPGGH
jgi:hypothetical protein